MSFEFIEANIKDLFVIKPKVFGDSRGYFLETYKQSEFNKFGLNYNFIQSNQSKSHKNVLRGLHFQLNKPQAKLVRVVYGSVYDVAVDLRDNSKTYGKYFGVTLTDENHEMFMIPRGFAHGFVVLSEIAIFEYLVDDEYDPTNEGGIIFNDKDINIKWPVNYNLDLSKKDFELPTLNESKVIFRNINGKLIGVKNDKQ